MSSSRRDFLKILGIGAAAGMSAQPVPAASAASSAGPIRLDNNESAYGPSEKVVEAIRVADAEAGRFPSGASAAQLADGIAQVHHVSPDQVVLGAGSTEVLRMASCACLESGKQLVQASPTFPALELYARSTGATVISDPLTPRFHHDLDAMLAHAGASAGLVYICNPNNPTASITPRADLEKFISRLPGSCYILIDEAYHHYAEPSSAYASFLDQPLNDPRIIVSRTFSHIYGLAGLRVGYGIASAETATRLRAFGTVNAVSTLAIRAAIAALDDTASLKEFVKKNTDARQEFVNTALTRSIKQRESHTNFFAVETFNPAIMVIQHFRANNILIAPVSLSWDTWIRVSLGKPEEMNAFWRAWDTLPIDKSAIRH
ncbi:MAG: histidinol-phosphate aminotransferase family protein [Acidobacteriia bacterium]|nr:histidinol-phosphate aminotransferase family protein [Terriglobia bacterium]